MKNQRRWVRLLEDEDLDLDVDRVELDLLGFDALDVLRVGLL